MQPKRLPTLRCGGRGRRGRRVRVRCAVLGGDAGREIEITTYADTNLSIECHTCRTIIADIDFWVN